MTIFDKEKALEKFLKLNPKIKRQREDYYQETERNRRIREKRDKKYLVMLTMRYVHKCTYQKIANKYGVTLQAVRRIIKDIEKIYEKESNS